MTSVSLLLSFDEKGWCLQFFLQLVHSAMLIHLPLLLCHEKKKPLQSQIIFFCLFFCFCLSTTFSNISAVVLGESVASSIIIVLHCCEGAKVRDQSMGIWGKAVKRARKGGMWMEGRLLYGEAAGVSYWPWLPSSS